MEFLPDAHARRRGEVHRYYARNSRGCGVIFVLPAIGFGAAAYWNWFRFHTIGTILTLFLTGVMAFLYALEVGAILPTPWLGLAERISIYVYDLWQVMIAIVLLQAEKGSGSII